MEILSSLGAKSRMLNNLQNWAMGLHLMQIAVIEGKNENCTFSLLSILPKKTLCIIQVIKHIEKQGLLEYLVTLLVRNREF